MVPCTLRHRRTAPELARSRCHTTTHREGLRRSRTAAGILSVPDNWNPRTPVSKYTKIHDNTAKFLILATGSFLPHSPRLKSGLFTESAKDEMSRMKQPIPNTHFSVPHERIGDQLPGSMGTGIFVSRFWLLSKPHQFQKNSRLPQYY